MIFSSRHRKNFILFLFFIFGLMACNSEGKPDTKQSAVVAGEFKQTTKAGVKKEIYAKAYFSNRVINLDFISPTEEEDTSQTMGMMRFELGDKIKVRWGYNAEHNYVKDYKLTHEKIFDTNKYHRYADQIEAIELVYHGNEEWELKLYDSMNHRVKKEIAIEDPIKVSKNKKKNKTKVKNNNTTGTSKTPELLWKFKTGSWISSSPTVKKETVYIGNNDGYLYAVNGDDGTNKWKFQGGKHRNLGKGIHSSPAVDKQNVYFGSVDKHVYAVSRDKGKLVWKFKTMGGKISGEIYSSPRLDKDYVYIGDDRLFFYALKRKNGNVEWKQKLFSVLTSPYIIDESIFIGGNSNNLYKVDIITGEKEWTFEINHGAVTRGFSSPHVKKGTVYVGCSNGYFYAIDSETGKEKWNKKISDPYVGGFLHSAPTLAKNTIFIGSDNGYLYAINEDNGKINWKFQTKKAIDSNPVVSDGVVYFGSDDKHLYAVNAETGKEKWAFKTGRVVDSSPAVTKERIYVGSRDGYLYAIKKQK